MKHSIFGYLLGEGFRNVFHNKKSSGASLAIMCATMLIFGLFFMIIENLNNAVETLETQQGIQVFIQKTATDAQMEQIGEQIQAIDGVNKVTFVSKEDALNQTKEKLKDKQALIAGWDESNPFKASYLVTLTDLKLSSQVQDEIKKIDNIDSIQSRDETINGLVAIANCFCCNINIASINIYIHHRKHNKINSTCKKKRNINYEICWSNRQLH